MSKRAVTIDMDREMEEGTALVMDETGLRHEFIPFPTGRPAEWAVRVCLSIEDYGKFLRWSSDRQNG